MPQQRRDAATERFARRFDAFRDLDMEAEVMKMTQSLGVGAQFGGKYFCHDVRVIRLPRHGASLPIGLGVSCSADRQAMGKITRDGIYLEQLETNPAQYLPDVEPAQLSGEVVPVDLDRGMAHTLATLTKHPVKTRVSLTGTLIVARDAAHAKLKDRLDGGQQPRDAQCGGAVSVPQPCAARLSAQLPGGGDAARMGEGRGRLSGRGTPRRSC